MTPLHFVVVHGENVPKHLYEAIREFELAAAAGRAERAIAAVPIVDPDSLPPGPIPPGPHSHVDGACGFRAAAIVAVVEAIGPGRLG